MRPYFWAFMTGTAARMARNADLRFKATVASQSAGTMVSTGTVGVPMPALFTRMSRRPHSSVHAPDHRLDLCLVQDIAGDDQRLAAGVSDGEGASARGRRLCGRSPLPARRGCQHFGRGSADPARGAGHQGDTIRE